MKLYLTIEKIEKYDELWFLMDIKKPNGGSVGLEVCEGRYYSNWLESQGDKGKWNVMVVKRMKKWEIV